MSGLPPEADLTLLPSAPLPAAPSPREVERYTKAADRHRASHDFDAVLHQRADGGEPIFRCGRLHRIEQRADELARHRADQLVAVLALEGIEYCAADALRLKR